MRRRDLIRVDLFDTRRHDEPLLHLLNAGIIELELLHHLVDEGALLVRDLQICPGEGADELHEAEAVFFVQVGELHCEGTIQDPIVTPLDQLGRNAPPMWKRILHFLTHDPARERVREERVRIERAIGAFATEANQTWLVLVQETLFHQGTPQTNAAYLIERIQRGASYGWDEADYEVFDNDVVVTFLGESARAPKQELLALLHKVHSLRRL